MRPAGGGVCIQRKDLYPSWPTALQRDFRHTIVPLDVVITGGDHYLEEGGNALKCAMYFNGVPRQARFHVSAH